MYIHQPACASYHPSDAGLCQSQRCSSTARTIPLGAAPIDPSSRGGWDSPRRSWSRAGFIAWTPSPCTWLHSVNSK
ncbi:uncharacterized protein TrAtP1_005676 [Trichoderma atroviride]|uniref:uncharacterized protein n=1 Tax=Hypocrea atroviridis TaxID=63577 RepID=UPI00331A5AB5|nr:hypothetical protein TrAtP1_005676 [Trichoderma atroviride]